MTAATVSRALNNTGRISDKTRKKVKETAEKFNYRPNSLAASLRNGKSNSIGVIVPTINRAFFSSIVRGLEEIAKENSYQVIIAQSNDDHETEVGIIDTMINAQVEGIFVSMSKDTSDFSHYRKIKDSGIKLIQFDRTTDSFRSNQVVLDDFLGAFMATQHLIDQGCVKIVHLSGQHQINIYKERLRGYKEALSANNILFNEDLVIRSNMQLKDGIQAVHNLLEKRQMFDAIFSSSDYAAMGAIQVLKKEGIQVPNDVAVVGFMDEPFTEFTEPMLSSVRQFPVDMGRQIAKLFFEELGFSEKKYYSKKIIEPELKIRASSLKKS